MRKKNLGLCFMHKKLPLDARRDFFMPPEDSIETKGGKKKPIEGKKKKDSQGIKCFAAANGEEEKTSHNEK